MKLSRTTLAEIADGVGKPSYRAEDLRAGIVHFGVGNFHRSHQQSYLDRLFSRGRSCEWAVVGAGVLPVEERMRHILTAQDYLTLLVTQSSAESNARVIGPMVDFLPIGDEAAIVARLVDPAIRIVSLTVTEGGYFLDANGNFDPNHDAIRADGVTPEQPRTVFGMILKALVQRREAGVPPFTIMSCDNLPHNGKLTQSTMVGLAHLTDPALAKWVEENVAFPNGMVDRITPVTSDRERLIAREDYGVEDEWPVFSEDYIQWVLEDNFPQGRPALEEVGVTFVDDVTPYEEMKLRILNASHAMIAYPAALLGIEYAHDAVTHPLIASMLEKVQRNEVIPGVTPVAEMEPSRYFDLVRARFANPKIADTIERLCYDGSNRQPKFLVPAIRHALSHGLPIDGLALASALWCHYCAGVRDDGTPIAANDPKWDQLHEAAVATRTQPNVWLDQESIYSDVGQSTIFRNAFREAVGYIYQLGLVGAIERFLKDRTVISENKSN